MHRNYRMLIVIAILLAAALWIVWPGLKDIPGSMVVFGKQVETRLGLDLVGGVQALLEADLPETTTITQADMATAVRIMENRVNALGVSEAVVQQAGDRRILVELPGELDPEQAVSAIRTTALLEFVDLSELDPSIAQTLRGNAIQTDFAQGEDVTAVVTNTILADRSFPTIMTGAELRNAAAQQIPETGQIVVSFELTPPGAQIFREYTTAHVGDVLAIVLDKKIISPPIINEPITDGQGMISGNFTQQEANELAVQLRYGALPIPLKVVETRTIGPTLGEDSLQKSLVAGVIGFTIVILFMALYYRLPGVVADVVIIIYALFAFAVFRFIPVTLTLPGIAGFLLSTGAALDANILIFERMKEELRSGRTISQAIDLGWRRAWPSIRDSNFATLITSGILYWFGSTFGATIVKGFSLTLALGVAISLFTALVVTRVLLSVVLERFNPENKVRWFGI